MLSCTPAKNRSKPRARWHKWIFLFLLSAYVVWPGLAEGSVLAWGDNAYQKTNVPVGLDGVVALAAGFDHSLALRQDGTVVGWGRNYEGQVNIPAGLSNVLAIAGGGYHSVALLADGTVSAWGYNSDGQARVPNGLTEVVGVAAGGFHTVVLRSDGRVLAWGSNTYHQTNVPPDLSNVIAIAAGGHHSLALCADGTVTGWGRNDSGQIDVPPRLANVVAVVAGHQHSVALKADGTAVAWGLNLSGQTDVPSDLTNLVAIAGIGYHTLALRTDGSPVAWGNAGSVESTIPADVTNVAAIAGGWGHTLAVPGPLAPCILAQPVGRTVYARRGVAFRVSAAGSLPLQYQWQFNGAPLADATNAVLSLPQVQETNNGTYRVLVSNLHGTVTSAKAILTVQMPLEDALDTTNLEWTTTVSVPWFGQTNVTHDRADALQSGPVADGQQTTLQTAVTGPGTLSFWWKVSSETNADTVRFQIGLATQASLSGEADWCQETYYLSPGNKLLQWRYAKNSNTSSGQDTAWVDELSYVPGGTGPVMVDQPPSQQILAGDNASLFARAVGTPPLSYQWQKNGMVLVGATNATLTLTNLRRHDSGWVTVTVTNIYGQALSSNAFLLVRAPQQFVQPTWTAGEGFRVLFGDSDGSELLPGDVAGFEVQASTNLVNWIKFPPELVLTNGLLLLQDPVQGNFPARFYRVLER
jgi:hypothetical protein